MPNAELAYRVLDHIDAHPESWDQEIWISRSSRDACGTAACFAGWVCLLSGDQPLWSPDYDEVTPLVNKTVDVGVHIYQRVSHRAAELLRIDEDDADDLFDANNTREGLIVHVAEIFGPRPTP